MLGCGCGTAWEKRRGDATVSGVLEDSKGPSWTSSFALARFVQVGLRVRISGREVKKSATTRWSVPLVHSLAGVIVVLITILAFFPALQNGFVTWDDGKNIYENPHYRGLGWAELRWMFTTFRMGHYQPLTWVTLGLDYLLWGMNPFGYHLTSLIFHALNALLFYFLVLRLLSLACTISGTSDGWGLRLAAGFAALFFAIHPLRVESVAWATERRDVLSGLFLLWTVLLYLRAGSVQDHGLRWRWLSMALIVYALSLLSKATGIALPVVLLALDVYPLGRLGGGEGRWLGREARAIWWEKAPFLVFAAIAGVIALLAQKQAGALQSIEQHGVVIRIMQGLFGFVFYMWKTALPIGLSPLYELPELKGWSWPFILSGVAVLGLTLGLYLFRRRWPAGLAVWVCYGAILAPALGFVQSGPQFVADRYSYLSCLGWAVLAGGGLFYLWRYWVSGKIARGLFMGVGVLSVMVLVGLGVLTWRQTQVWHDSETLWRHALAVTQGSSTIDFNLAVVLHNHGKLEEAIDHYRRSIEFNPNVADAHYYLADALAERGNLREAIEEYRWAVQVDPGLWRAHFNLANALASQGNLEEAVWHYLQVVRIEPAFGDAHYQLGDVLAALGDLDNAVQHYQKAIRLDPTRSEIHLNLGNALIRQGRLDEAASHFEAAIRLKPNMVRAYNNLGMLMAAQGRLDRAIDLFRQALRIEPEFAEAHESMAMALSQVGRRDEAMKHYQEAIRILKSRRQSSTQ